MVRKAFLFSVALLMTFIFSGTVAAAPAQQNDTNRVVTSPERVLIAYFSLSGNTRLIARDIQNLVGGDLFEIKTVRQYGPDFDAAVEQAREDLRTNARPELVSKVTNMQAYDVVFVGFPNWVGTMPMAVYSFLEQHNFTGKKIVPFCTHGTSGVGNTVSDLKKLNLQAEIQPHIGIYRNDVKTAETVVAEWLRAMGYIH